MTPSFFVRFFVCGALLKNLPDFWRRSVFATDLSATEANMQQLIRTIKDMLCIHGTQRVETAPTDPGEFEFVCQTGTLRAKLIVEQTGAGLTLPVLKNLNLYRR